MKAGLSSGLSETVVSEWTDLLKRGGRHTPFEHPAWKGAWLEILAPQLEPEMVEIREAGRMVALAPLVWTGEAALEMMGGEDVSDYLDFIFETDRGRELIPKLLSAIDELPWRRLTFESMEAAAITPGEIRAWVQSKGYDLEESETTVCPLIELADDWESYLAGLSKKHRHELRRKLRRLEGAGESAVYWIERSEDLPAALDDFVRLMRLSDRGKADFLTENMERFFRTMVEREFQAGLVRLFFMEFEGKRVASTICFDDGGAHLYLYNSGFDPAYSKLSVGLLLKALNIRHAIETGKRCFNTLRGNERYKYDLGAHDTSILRLAVTRP